jgi:hypothetical protein
MDAGSETIAIKLLDVLRREENAILSGRWEKLAPLDRLRSRLWKSLSAETALSLSRKMAETLRDQSDKNTRLLTDALAEVGEKLVAARRHSHASAAYGQA